VDLSIKQTLMRSTKSRAGLTEGRVFHESGRHLWILSSNTSAIVHSVLVELTNLYFNVNEQHTELGLSRRETDFEDCRNFTHG
jgi:hypothetical protein